MKKELFFKKEEVYSEKSFHNYILKTNSPYLFSYIFNKEEYNKVNLELDKTLFLKHKKLVNKDLEIIEFDKFLDEIEFQSYSFYDNNLKIVNKNKKKNYFENYKKIQKKEIDYEDVIFLRHKNIYKLLENIQNNIISDIFEFKISEKFTFRIIVESKKTYELLSKYIFDNKINISFKEYNYFYESSLYKKLMEYIDSDINFSKDYIKNILKDYLNKKDLILNKFISILKSILLDILSKEQLLFYLLFYKNLFISNEFNSQSKIELVLLSELEYKRNTLDYLILDNAYTYEHKFKMEYDFNRMCCLLNNYKIYCLKSLKNPNENYKFNILNLLSKY